MKTIKNFKSVILGLIFLANISFAETPSFKVNVSNLNHTSKNTLEFDIFLLNGNNENSKQEGLRYSLGQYFFDFNPKIANGGNLNYKIADSDLPEAMRPRNASVKDNQLRLIVNSVSADKGNLPVFIAKSPGLLIARMKLETSADKFADTPLELQQSKSIFKTKVFAFDGKKNIELSNSDYNSIEGVTGKLTNESITNIPAEYALAQNYPNPFNPETKINYELPIANYVTLKVYDMTGKEIMTLVNENQNAGRYTATFNGSNLASGMYFYKITAGEFTFVRKMVLIK
ncbi:MAG: T9SS type A sorting domain-containing protein [Ignavibacteria bacterium]|nr:T9SS type A sorting domain-containing protein [Ignavibacteria bacterium]